jgi:hypothetical protein
MPLRTLALRANPKKILYAVRCHERRVANLRFVSLSPHLKHPRSDHGPRGTASELPTNELGGKTEAIISAANDLMNFVTKGPSADAGAAALEPAGAPNEVSAPAAEPVVTDRIAACGTALEMPESGDLAHAEPVIEVKAATEAEPAAAAEETEAVPSEAAAEEVATITAPTAEVEATELVEPSPGPIEPPAEATNGGSAGPAVAPEVEAATVAAAPAASASEVVAPSSEEHASAAAPLTEGSGQEHTAN